MSRRNRVSARRGGDDSSTKSGAGDKTPPQPDDRDSGTNPKGKKKESGAKRKARRPLRVADLKVRLPSRLAGIILGRRVLRLVQLEDQVLLRQGESRSRGQMRPPGSMTQ